MESTSQRPTKEFKTISGYSVTMKTYITGREANSIQDVFINDTEVRNFSQKSGGGTDVDFGEKGFKTNKIREAQELTIMTMITKVLSPEGQGFEDPKAILNTILDMPKSDYNEVQAELNVITDPKLPTEK